MLALVNASTLTVPLASKLVMHSLPHEKLVWGCTVTLPGSNQLGEGQVHAGRCGP